MFLTTNTKLYSTCQNLIFPMTDNQTLKQHDLYNYEDNGERKDSNKTIFLLYVVLNLLHKVTSQEIHMTFHGYLIWSLIHNITKDTYLFGSIPFLLAHSGILFCRDISLCQIKTQRRGIHSFTRKGKCYEGAETTCKWLTGNVMEKSILQTDDRQMKT